MSPFSFLYPAKDLALKTAVKLWFNQAHKRYGQLVNNQL